LISRVGELEGGMGLRMGSSINTKKKIDIVCVFCCFV
jgi:hypothetical protein